MRTYAAPPPFAHIGGLLILALLAGLGGIFAVSTLRAKRLGGSPSLLLTASPLRATLEGVVLAAALVIASLALTLPAIRTDEPVSLIDPTLVLLAGPVCALWCAIRLRIPSRPASPQAGLWRWVATESAIGAILALAPFAITVASVYATYLFLEQTAPHPISVELARGVRGLPLPLFALLLFVAFSLEFVIFRVGVRLWLRWNHLRRTQLQWSLTHGILVTAALAAGVLIVLILLLASAASQRSVFTLAPVIFFLSFLSLLGLLIVLPPSAIFSYVFARYMTRRLDTLIGATNALRAGDYTARVPVSGEDEVAQLQTNFNAMAADLERAVRELETERDHVATLLRSRRELVASVSHELRTPIATLRSYLESARMTWDRAGGAPPATLRHDLEVMERETIALQGLIQDLFSLSRAEVGTLDLVIAPTDVAALARRVVETMAPLAWQSNRVELVASSGANLPQALALADAGRLEQVLRNLLHNGMRHTPPGGIVAVEVGAEPAGVVIRVRDTGEGIAPEDLPRVFDRFYRGQNARERGSEGSGSGLGLALVKEMTEAMGGSVAVESAAGAGATFTLHLLGVGVSQMQPAPRQTSSGRSGAPTERAGTEVPGPVESPAAGR